MRQKVDITAGDVIDYSYCTYCNVTFKTEGCLSVMKQVYKTHCDSKKHQAALLNPDYRNDDQDIKITVEKLQKQVDILIHAVKILNEQKEEVELRCSRAENQLRILREDLFGRKNQYGKEHENMLEYKSLNERLKALETGVIINKVEEVKQDKVEPIKQEKVQFDDEINVIEKEECINEEDDIEQFNPYKIKEKTEFTNTFEFEDKNVMLINNFANIVNEKDDKDDNIENLENIQFEYEKLELWIVYIEKNNTKLININKIKIIKEELYVIITWLGKIIKDYTKYYMDKNKPAIVTIYEMMLKYSTKQHTVNDLI